MSPPEVSSEHAFPSDGQTSSLSSKSRTADARSEIAPLELGESRDLQAKITRLKSDLMVARKQLASIQSNQWRLDPAHAFAHETDAPQDHESGLYNHPDPNPRELGSETSPDTRAEGEHGIATALQQERDRTIHLAWGAAVAATMLVIVAATGITTGQMFAALVVLIVAQAILGVVLGTWAFVSDRVAAQIERPLIETLPRREGLSSISPTKSRQTKAAKF